VRGGSIPFIAWGTLNLALLVLNWIWEGTGIHVAEFGFTVVVIYLAGLVLLMRRREAVRRGPPEFMSRPDALPRMSYSAAGIGIAIGVTLFGLVFGNVFVYIGAALFLFSLLRLSRELRSQRQTLETIDRDGPP
jgi:uncharacterized iron-regulated membrane protein